jgi:hypothetical protein
VGVFVLVETYSTRSGGEWVTMRIWSEQRRRSGATGDCDGSQGETVDQLNACTSTPVPPCLFLTVSSFRSPLFFLPRAFFGRAELPSPLLFVSSFSFLSFCRAGSLLFCVPRANHTFPIVIGSPLSLPRRTHYSPFAQHPLLAGLTI